MSETVRIKTDPDMATTSYKVDSVSDDLIGLHITEPDNFQFIDISKDYASNRFFVALLTKDGRIDFAWLGEANDKRWDSY